MLVGISSGGLLEAGVEICRGKKSKPWSPEMDASVAQHGEDRLPASSTEFGGCGLGVGLACLTEGETEERGDPNPHPHVNVVELGFRLPDHPPPASSEEPLTCFMSFAFSFSFSFSFLVNNNCELATCIFFSGISFTPSVKEIWGLGRKEIINWEY